MMIPSTKHAMGIMTTQSEGNPPFLNRSFYRKLCLLGGKSGLTMFVFTPSGIHRLEGTVAGFAFDSAANGWKAREYAMPDVVYDRCFFSSGKQFADYREAVEILRDASAIFLGSGLKGKWDVQQMLESDGQFDSCLPKTEPMRGVRSAVEWLKERSAVLLKPQAGSQGRGVLLVQRTEAGGPRQHAPESAGSAEPAFTVRGRDSRNRRVERSFADAAELLRWLQRFTAKRDYLLQQYLLLQSPSGAAYDVRSLVQKDGSGRWQLTGMAVRLGQSGSLTSNLHGGGKVEPALGFLTGAFGAAKAKQISGELERLSTLIPAALERHHGRLAELGIDFGVDIDGRIWILEVNSKPGRSIFSYLRDTAAQYKALANPIQYARYLIRSSGTAEPKISIPDTPRSAKSQRSRPDKRNIAYEVSFPSKGLQPPLLGIPGSRLRR